MTTGENLAVTWDNIVATCTSWIAHPRYDAGSFGREVVRHGGMYLYDGDVPNVVDSVTTIPTGRRDDFIERVRYWYGGCINLEESRAIDPKKLT